MFYDDGEMAWWEKKYRRVKGMNEEMASLAGKTGMVQCDGRRTAGSSRSQGGTKLRRAVQQ
jgi:hypothetical protein